MAIISMGEIGKLSYREALGPAGTDAPTALLLHGFPETSRMWLHTMTALADAGWRVIAPDLYDLGSSTPTPPATWERALADIDALHTGLNLGPVVLGVHDWGGLSGLAWACDHPDAVRALVISDTGFFADSSWHDLALAMRTPGVGEDFMAAMTADSFAALLANVSTGITPDAVAEYWAGLDRSRTTPLDFYRSADFDKLAPYSGRLAALGVPTLILWGESDPFAPVASAHRFHREIPGSELLVLPGGHFIYEDAPEPAAAAVLDFLRRLPG